MFKFTVIILLLLILLNVCSGCVAVPGVVSAVAIPAAEGYSTFKTVSTTKAVVDLKLAASDKKTTNDIVLSNITGKDCKLQDKFKKGKMCTTEKE